MENIFTTEVIKPDQRAEFWQRFVCKFITDVDCTIDAPDQFYGEIRNYAIGRLALSILSAAPHKVGRREERIQAEGNASLIVIYQKSGIANYSQGSRTACLEKGDFILYDPLLPYYMELPTDFEQVLFQFPRNALRPLIVDLPDIIGNPVIANTPGGDLCGSLINTFEKRIKEFNQVSMHGFAETIVNLIIQTIGSELCNNLNFIGKINGSTIARAKQYIIDNLKSPDLSLQLIAKHTGVSGRHLSRLFQSEGLSVSKWMKMVRMERCASALVNPAYSGKTIAEIAYEFGFNDISHFSRDFKAIYGLTPSDYRSSYAAETPADKSPAGE